MMIKSLCCVKIEARELLTYDGLSVVDEFMSKFENAVPEQQQFDALKSDQDWILQENVIPSIPR